MIQKLKTKYLLIKDYIWGGNAAPLIRESEDFMKKITVEVTNVKGVSIESLKKAYDKAIKATVTYWEKHCVIEFDPREYGPLVSTIKLTGCRATSACYIPYASFDLNRNKEAGMVDLLEKTYFPYDATEYAMDNLGPFVLDNDCEYKKEMKKRAQEYAKEHPLEFKSFEQVVSELIAI